MNLYTVRFVTEGTLAITLEFPSMSTEEAKFTAETMWDKISSVIYTDDVVEMIVEIKEENV